MGSLSGGSSSRSSASIQSSIKLICLKYSCVWNGVLSPHPCSQIPSSDSATYKLTFYPSLISPSCVVPRSEKKKKGKIVKSEVERKINIYSYIYVKPRKVIQMNQFAKQKWRDTDRGRAQTYKHQGGRREVGWIGSLALTYRHYYV